MSNSQVDRLGIFVRNVVILIAAVIIAGFFVRGDVLWEMFTHVLTGWFTTARRLMESPPFSRRSVAVVAGGFFVFFIGSHAFAVWLQHAMSILGDSRRWRLRTSAAMVSLIVCLFLAGICMIGVTHQAAWLSTDPAGVVETRDNFLIQRRSQDPTAEDAESAENR